MRRLPIYFLVDVSESMVGESQQRVQMGLETILRQLRSDPHALETAWISVVVFAGKAKTLVPLTELLHFYPPQLPVGSGTALGAGLNELMERMQSEVRFRRDGAKGDWKPLVFILTDGAPTDDCYESIKKWREVWAEHCQTVAVAMGKSVDMRVLQNLSEYVLRFDHTSPAAYAEFFSWVSASIQSRSTGAAQTAPLRLEKEMITVQPGEYAEKVDENYAFVMAKCSRYRYPYLMRYVRNFQKYFADKSFPLTDSYFELSEGGDPKTSVIASELHGVPACAHCGAEAFGRCSCGGLLCLPSLEDEESIAQAQCPHCHREITFRGGGDGDFEVGRGLG